MADERVGVDRGWWVVAGLFLVLTVSSGFGFYNLSVYMNVLAAELGFAISQVSVAVSLFFVVGGVAGIGVAHLMERFDVRWIMIAGAALGALGLGLSASATSLAELYALYLLFGIGNSGVSIVVSTTLVTRWFPGKRRSVALSVASTGLSMGGVILTPLCARLLNDMSAVVVMPWFGAAFFFLIVPVVLAVIRDGRVRAPLGTSGPVAEGWTYRDAVASRFFRLFTAAYVLCMASQVGGISHLYNHAETTVDYLIAATAVQTLSAMSILSRIVGGFVLQSLSVRWFTLANLIGQGVGLGLLALAENTAMVLTGAAVFGATVGNLLMLHPLWLAQAFGARAYPRIFSVSNAFTVLGVAAGPMLLGLLYDAAGYRLAFGVAVATTLGAVALLMLAGPGADEGGAPLEQPRRAQSGETLV